MGFAVAVIGGLISPYCLSYNSSDVIIIIIIIIIIINNYYYYFLDHNNNHYNHLYYPYHLLFIGVDGSIVFSVLPLPKRYPFLMTYFGIICVFILFALQWHCNG